MIKALNNNNKKTTKKDCLSLSLQPVSPPPPPPPPTNHSGKLPQSYMQAGASIVYVDRDCAGVISTCALFNKYRVIYSCSLGSRDSLVTARVVRVGVAEWLWLWLKTNRCTDNNLGVQRDVITWFSETGIHPLD